MRSFITSIAAGLVATLVAALPAFAQGIGYGGRVVGADGKPLKGAIDLEVRFFDQDTNGAQLGPTLNFDDVELTQGVFQIAIDLGPADADVVYGGDVTWIQIKDKTNNRILPRQQFLAVPYALRVPVDGTTIDYDNDGKLRMGPPAPGVASFLKIDAGGSLIWEASGGSGTVGAGTVDTVAIIDGNVTDAKIDTMNATKLTGTVDPARYSAYADLSAESKIGTGAAQVAAGDHNHTGVYANSSHTHGNADITALDGAKISTGTIDPARYSAYSDLTAESKIGTGAAQVAAGDHAHGNADITALDGAKISTGTVDEARIDADIARDSELPTAASIATGFANDAVSGDKVHGGTISSFASTGIDDNADALAMTIDASERVGIGTASPALPLHVSGAGHTANFDSTYNTASAGAGIYLRNTAAGGAAATNSRIIAFSFADPLNAQQNTAVIEAEAESVANGNIPTSLKFLTGSSYGTLQENMSITASGNVGIGTTSPETKLDVAGGDILVDNNSFYRAEDNTGVNAQVLGFDTSNNLVINRQTLITGNDYKTIIGGDTIEFRDASNGTDVFIDTNGNVGVGTTSPTAKLQVNYSGPDGINVGKRGGTASDTYVYLGASDGANFGLIGAYKGDASGAANLSINNNGGNVGVGTTSPTSKLEVAGDIKASGTGKMLMGYVAHRYQANAAMIRAACPANTIVLNGGCICAAGYMYTSYASVETTDATTQGTPIADGATTAGSWSCSCSSSSPTNSATVTCARIGN